MDTPQVNTPSALAEIFKQTRAPATAPAIPTHPDQFGYTEQGYAEAVGAAVTAAQAEKTAALPLIVTNTPRVGESAEQTAARDRSWADAAVNDLDVAKAVAATKVPDPDAITRPNHYARYKIEPIYFIMENNLPFVVGNVVKYTLRYDAKDGIQDLKKARRYLDMLIKQLEGDKNYSL